MTPTELWKNLRECKLVSISAPVSYHKTLKKAVITAKYRDRVSKMKWKKSGEVWSLQFVSLEDELVIALVQVRESFNNF